MAARDDISAEYVRELLNYDPMTGEFYWREARGSVSSGYPANYSTGGYTCIRIDGVLYKAHRLAWLCVYGEWPDGEIDHADLDRSNNRIENLRCCSREENARNRIAYRNNQSGFKGIYWDKSRAKWSAMIMKSGKRHCLGRFDDIKSAQAAYREAAQRLHVEFSRAD